MERSEGEYEEMHSYRHPKNEEYANDSANDSGVPRPRNIKERSVWSRLAVVLVGLLCVLLLCVIIGLSVIISAERHQSQTDINRLKTEEEELKTNLTKEKNQLHDQHNQLHDQCNQMKLQCSELLSSYRVASQESKNLQLRLCKLVEVTLDPDSANHFLILSANKKQVRVGNRKQSYPDNAKRFDDTLDVLGKEGFSSGRFYYEVLVEGKTEWDLGVTRESSKRKGRISLHPEEGYWTICLRNEDEYEALDGKDITLLPLNRLDRVGVFVDYEAGLVSFYNADQWELLYSFTHANFNDTIYPYFSPGDNKPGWNSSPLVITTPVPCDYQHNN